VITTLFVVAALACAAPSTTPAAIVGSFKPSKNIALDLGCALFVPMGAALGRGTQPAAWTYAQLNVQL
jgi:hypothetical protein